MCLTEYNYTILIWSWRVYDTGPSSVAMGDYGWIDLTAWNEMSYWMTVNKMPEFNG